MAAKNVLNLSPVEFKEFLDSFDYVFSDLDGVLWRGVPFPKAGEFINTLKKLGKKVYYISNNSSRTHDNNVAKFREINIDLKCEDLYFPAKVITHYLRSINFNKAIYTSTCNEAKKFFEENGFICKDGPEDILDCDSSIDLEKFLIDDEEIGAVVLDSDCRCNLGKMYRAAHYLRRPEVLFIIGATDKYFALSPGRALLGPGHFNHILEEFTGRKPLTFGKPGLELLEFLKRDIGVVNTKRVLFIGDIYFHSSFHSGTVGTLDVNHMCSAVAYGLTILLAVSRKSGAIAMSPCHIDMIDQDIAFGRAGGFQTLFVTSSFTVDDAIKKNTPDYYVTALGDILPQFDKL